MPTTQLNISKKKFTTAYWKIAAIKSRFRVVMGGSDASKSFSVAQDEILKGLRHVEKVLVIRKVASTLKDSVYQSFKNRLNEFQMQGFYEATLSPLDITLGNGTKFLFRGLDDPEKMKSIEGITRIVVEEASEIDIDDFKELNRRLRNGDAPQFTLMFNPIDENHWLKKHFFDVVRENAETLTVTYLDNEYVKPESVTELLALKDYDENQYNIYALAEWGSLKTGSEWYPHFSKVKVVTDVVCQYELRHTNISWDFNVVPYISCICAQVVQVPMWINDVKQKFTTYMPGLLPITVNQVRVYKEYAFANPKNSSKAVSEQFAADHPLGMTLDYYGDAATGNARLQGLGTVTPFGLIKEEFDPYLYNQSRKAKQSNIAVLKRRDLMNEIFFGKHPDIEILIDKDCKELIDDLKNCKQGVKGKLKKRVKNTATGETYEEHGHMSDALEYLVCEIFRDRIKNA